MLLAIGSIKFTKYNLTIQTPNTQCSTEILKIKNHALYPSLSVILREILRKALAVLSSSTQNCTFCPSMEYYIQYILRNTHTQKRANTTVHCLHIYYVYKDSLTLSGLLSQSAFTHMYRSKRYGAEILKNRQKPPLIIFLAIRDLLKSNHCSNLLTL